jgi:hypothetical protein
MNEHYRQGDVLLVRVETLPAGATQEHNDESVVLAYGETTGHAHRLDAATVTMYAWQGDKLIEVRKPTDLTHEEHSALKIAPGFYKVVQQREYTPERVRNVCD